MTVPDIVILIAAACIIVPSLQRRLGWAVGSFRRNFSQAYKDGKKSTKVEVEEAK